MSRERETKLTIDVLNFIVDWVNTHGYSPTSRQIGNEIHSGRKVSTSVIDLHIKKLVKHGDVAQESRDARTIVVTLSPSPITFYNQFNNTY